MWRAKGKLAISAERKCANQIINLVYFKQGFFTAIANPKGWAFMVSLLPPFINPDLQLAPQLSYASGSNITI